VPWSMLTAAIGPFYPKAEGRGRPPIGLERMLRMYIAQQCFGLSDEGIMDAVYDSQAIRGFVGIDLSCEGAPRCNDVAEVPSPAREAQADRTNFPIDQRAPDREGPDSPGGNGGRCEHHRCAAVDEEPGWQARSRDASDEEGKPVALRDEGAYRCRCRLGPDAYVGDDGGVNDVEQDALGKR